MDNLQNEPIEWSFDSRVGPVVLNIIIDTAFFQNTLQRTNERHTHATCEFHLITGGSGTIYTDNAQYNVAAGSYYIVKEGVYHKQWIPAENPLQKINFKFDYNTDHSIGGDYSAEEAKSFISSLSNIHFFYCKNSGKMIPVIYEIQKELTAQAPGYLMKVQLLFSLLFVEVTRDIASQSRHAPTSREPMAFRENRINIIDNFFDMNYSYKATTQDLCKLVRISKSQLNRILREKYSMTFKQKHMEAQIEHIKDMLINTNLPIGAIAEKTGYASDSNFTAFFKHATGTTPKEYRKAARHTG
jgi:AraC-like DNA-binding protein